MAFLFVLGFNVALQFLFGQTSFNTFLSFIAAFLIGFNIRKFNDKLLGRNDVKSND
jgi:hypothetical protein